MNDTLINIVLGQVATAVVQEINQTTDPLRASRLMDVEQHLKQARYALGVGQAVTPLTLPKAAHAAPVDELEATV